jgi:2-isopropylmalate synthase
MKDPSKKYPVYKPVDLPERLWPSRNIMQAPLWCSVDLRDGNQALPIPMNLEEKLDLFKLLADIGFKEIEAGYPAASDTEYAFIRQLIDRNLIPGDVTIQVVTPCIESLIDKTFQAIDGAPRVIFHFLNSTSPMQRRQVYNNDEDATIALAVNAAKQIHSLGVEAEKKGMKLTYEYSPESFTETEPEFALQIVEEVLNALEASPASPVIINLPATVEKCLPNQYADLIEWFGKNVKDRNRFILSVHPHNDRGSAVAAAELALLAGAQRIEGTLFGNGERTGNVDLVTLALNLYTQGIDSGLNLSDIGRVRDVYQATTHQPVGPRQPYAGELVYTAFSGAHQDAILKVIDHRKKRRPESWQVP